MDQTTFDRRIEKLNCGEMITDPSIFSYVNDSLREYRRLFDALRRCCVLQAQKLDIQRQINRGLQNSYREKHTKVAELMERIAQQEKTIAELNERLNEETDWRNSHEML